MHRGSVLSFTLKRTLKVLGLLPLTLLTTACSSVVPVQFPTAQDSARVPAQTETVLLLLDDDLLATRIDRSQLMNTFRYELGEFVGHAATASLSSAFADVQAERPARSQLTHDIVVRPEILSFDAPVPPLVTMRTPATITLRYHLTRSSDGRTAELTATGTHELRNQDDIDLYASLPRRALYAGNLRTGVGMHVPLYATEAGRDAFMAVNHALEQLLEQLLAWLVDNDSGG